MLIGMINFSGHYSQVLHVDAKLSKTQINCTHEIVFVNLQISRKEMAEPQHCLAIGDLSTVIKEV